MNLLRTIIRRFDNWLRHIEGVEPFTNDPQCILRIQIGRVNHAVVFPEQTMHPGSEALFIHFWNEHMPIIPNLGADLAYGLKLQRLIIYSARLVAVQIQSKPSLCDVKIVGGITTFADGGNTFFQRLGFLLFPHPYPTGAFGEFWENFYGWWLMWAYNPVSAQHRKMSDMQHTEFWMSKEKFLKKYG